MFLTDEVLNLLSLKKDRGEKQKTPRQGLGETWQSTPTPPNFFFAFFFLFCALVEPL